MHFKHKITLAIVGSLAAIVAFEYWILTALIEHAKNHFTPLVAALAVFPLVATGTLGTIYARQVSRHITTFTETIDNISKGKLDARVHGKERADELGELARAFDRVLVSLKIAVEKVGLKKEELKLGEALEAKERAEQALNRERAHTQNIIKNAGVPIISYTRDGKLLLANKTFTTLTKYDEHDLASQEELLKKAFPPDAQTKIKNAIKNALNGKTITDLVIPLTCKDGTSTIVATNITPLTDEKGNTIGTTHFMRDLSEIFTLEQQVFSWVNSPVEEAPRNIQISSPQKTR